MQGLREFPQTRFAGGRAGNRGHGPLCTDQQVNVIATQVENNRVVTMDRVTPNEVREKPGELTKPPAKKNPHKLLRSFKDACDSTLERLCSAIM